MTARTGQGRCRGGEWVLVAAAVGGLSVAQATEFDYGLGYVYERSSNITRVPSPNERADTTHSLFAGLAYREDTPELLAYALAQAQFDRHSDDAFGDVARYYVDASLLWSIAPRLFTWTVQDRAQMALIDNDQPDTPDNRVGVNVFSTGPDLYLRPSSTNTLAFGARYGDVYIGDTGAGNTRVNANARWLYQLNSSTALSANVDTRRVKFDDADLGSDYERRDGFLRLDWRPTPNRITLDAGRSRIERDAPADSPIDEEYQRVTWLRQITAQTVFGMTYARGFEDLGDAMLADVTDPAVAPELALPVSDTGLSALAELYRVRRAEVFYRKYASDWAWELRLNGREYDYLSSTPDRHQRGAYGEISRQPGGVFTATLFADATNTEYPEVFLAPPDDDVMREDQDRSFGLRLRYRWTRHMALALEGSKIWRTSNAPDLDFTDRRLLFTLYYTSGPTYQPARR